ncbi:ferrous iron transport protein B [archaeon]|jgi:ferrous iron transport protein B|nr:ferrous iron transport protein B [archaeon]MDP6547409.1 ferrous iron transport protein B [Candidatus Woesearchaeota archaeon]|tara:strand:+ start:8767 stop:10767 length:2001 start_codon:yes stop_codon:yes gene_type:complete
MKLRVKNKEKKSQSCHNSLNENIEGLKKIVLVGNPNVGKSALFNRLSKAYVTVSNYPGTTVTIDISKAIIQGKKYGIMDTPGIYSLTPITEEERVARNVLLEQKPEVVLHVVDAKNIERMLHLTIELIEAKLPVILVLNIMDESEEKGLRIDIEELEKILNIPVVGTVSTTGKGINVLKKRIIEFKRKKIKKTEYNPILEDSTKAILKNLKETYPISKKAISLLLLQGDKDIEKLVKNKEPDFKIIKKIIDETKEKHNRPLKYLMTIDRQDKIKNIVNKTVIQDKKIKLNFREKLSRLMMNPLTGIPIFLAVIYFGLYQFVGVFGAGTLVDFLESSVFEAHINPYIDNFLTTYVPWVWLQNLIGMDYGIITLGLRYAIAIIFPIVATFFIVFSIIEDTGYLPRLAMLIDRIFKKIGLNGRAVIPMVLGFGCDTMATIVTRTQETKKERIITTLLLALAIPCSAQLGVIFAILSGYPKALMVWIFTTTMVFLFIGYLASKIIPGEKPYFYMEVPPLRTPKLSNVLTKTYTRMVWYFKEVLPLFILASILIWIGKLTGLFDLIISGLEPIVRFVGLPNETASTFLYGFFRRDYGVAGLYDIQNILTGAQLVVAATILTLFLPCIAQLSIMIKERGFKTTIAMVLFIVPFAFLVGFILNLILTTLGVQL